MGLDQFGHDSLDKSKLPMVVQSLENLEKSGKKILVKENLENLEKSGNFTERDKNVIGNNAFSY